MSVHGMESDGQNYDERTSVNKNLQTDESRRRNIRGHGIAERP
jgi:hypothetical protein